VKQNPKRLSPPAWASPAVAQHQQLQVVQQASPVPMVAARANHVRDVTPRASYLHDVTPRLSGGGLQAPAAGGGCPCKGGSTAQGCGGCSKSAGAGGCSGCAGAGPRAAGNDVRRLATVGPGSNARLAPEGCGGCAHRDSRPSGDAQPVDLHDPFIPPQVTAPPRRYSEVSPLDGVSPERKHAVVPLVPPGTTLRPLHTAVCGRWDRVWRFLSDAENRAINNCLQNATDYAHDWHCNYFAREFGPYSKEYADCMLTFSMGDLRDCLFHCTRCPQPWTDELVRDLMRVTNYGNLNVPRRIPWRKCKKWFWPREVTDAADRGLYLY